MDYFQIRIGAHEGSGEFGHRQRRKMKPPKAVSHVRLKNILYATDFSPAAERAFPFALQIACRYGATIHVLHVVQPNVYPLVPPTAWSQMEEAADASRNDSKRALEEQLRELPHEIVFQQGGVWENVSEAIRKKDIDLLILGTHGRTGLEKAAFGSVAEQALRQAACAALMVGPKVSVPPKGAAQWTRILYATDFSTPSLAAAPHAISLAREHRAQLILLHCADPDTDVPVMLRTLRDLVPFGSDLRSEPDCVVARGAPAEKILEISEEHGADIVVLGVDSVENNPAQKTYIARSGIYKILTRAKCPVLTVRS